MYIDIYIYIVFSIYIMYICMYLFFCKAGSFRIRKCCTFGATKFTILFLFVIHTTLTYLLKMNTHI